MSTAVQRRRGTNTEHDSFTGLEGEISVNTTNESVHVHDGSTAGGFEMARADLDNVANIDDTIIGATTPAAGTFTTFTSNGIDDNATTEVLQLQDTVMAVGGNSGGGIYDLVRRENDGSLIVSGGNSSSAGFNITMYGGGHATLPDYMRMRAGATTVMFYDDSAGRFELPVSDVVVGGESLGAASAVTLYADGTFKSNGIDDNATSNAITIDSSENVGINQSDPKGPLHVYGTDYSYFTSNVAGVTPHSTTQGIALGWNKSSGAGESIIAFNKGAGGTGGLVFADNNGGTYAERLRIDASGNVGIGTPSPTARLHIVGDDTLTGITLRVEGGGVQDQRGIIFAVGGADYGFINIPAGSGGAMSFGTGSAGAAAERARIDTTGHFVVGGTTAGAASAVTLYADGKAYPAGGIYLGGTAAANLLDDYEEGTWTPSLTGTTSGTMTSFTTTVASYIKTGGLVNIFSYLTSMDFTAHTLLGNIRVSGLPFSATSIGQLVNISYCTFTTADEITNTLSGYCSGTGLVILKGSSIAALTDTDLLTTSNNACMLGITYRSL